MLLIELQDLGWRKVFQAIRGELCQVLDVLIESFFHHSFDRCLSLKAFNGLFLLLRASLICSLNLLSHFHRLGEIKANLRRDLLNAVDSLQLVLLALYQVQLSKGLGIQEKSPVRLTESKLTNELFFPIREGLQEKLEYFPVLRHCELSAEEFLLVLGEDIALEQRKVVLDEGSEVH